MATDESQRTPGLDSQQGGEGNSKETPVDTPDREGSRDDESSRPLSRPLSNRVPTLSGRAALSRTPVRMLDSAPSEDTPIPAPIPEERVLITEVGESEGEEGLGHLREEVEESRGEDEVEVDYEEEGGEDDDDDREEGEGVEEEREDRDTYEYVEDDYDDSERREEDEDFVREEPPQPVVLRDEDFDTDLEMDFEEDDKDLLVDQYEKACTSLGVVPVSYFLRRIKQPNVSMRYHGLGAAATRALALSLKDNIHIEKLNLQGNWMEVEGGEAMARMLEENDYVTEINLAENKICNGGAVHLCRMLNVNGGLRKLDLSGNEFDDKVAENFAEAIEKNQYLKELNLSKNRFGETAGEILGPAIGANEIMDVLDLSWNHLRHRGAAAIAKGLKENIRLKVCRLAWNGFGQVGGCEIAAALAPNQSLEEIDISGNRLTLEVAKEMAKTIQLNDTLRIIRMGNNLITTSGAIALASAINNTDGSEMEELDLTDVPVEYEFLRVIEEIKTKKPSFRVKHGPVLRSGNTVEDLGKPPIDPFRRKDPVVVMRENIIVNDLRLVDILRRYDTEGIFSVTPEDFLSALEELAVPYNKNVVHEAVHRLAEDQSGRIYFGDYAAAQQEEQKKEAEETT